MKHIFRRILLTALAIFIVANFLPGLSYGGSLLDLIIAGSVLALFNSVLRPFLKVLLLPLNVITLGIFGWFINVVILYLVTLVLPQFDVVPFTLVLGSTSLILNQFFAYILISFAITVVSNLVSWLIN